MRATGLLLATLVAALAASHGAHSAPAPRPHREELHQHHLSIKAGGGREHFLEWMSRHGKAYQRDAVEVASRFAQWMRNLEFVLEYNLKHTSHWLSVEGPLADLSREEYASRFLGYNHAAKKQLVATQRASNAVPRPSRYANVPLSSLPAAIDWRELNAVSEVKNQQSCGSCWAFSTTGSVEGISAIVDGKLQSLSEQELVDCDTVEDKGCRGGLMDYAYQFIIDNGGIDTESDYPYVGMEGDCKESKLARHAVTIDGFEDVPPNDEAALKAAVAHQPVSVAIEADQQAFQLYAGGVFADDTCGTQLDHGVLVVGYGTDPVSNLGYWVVKNSWGPEWGESGYIRLHQGVTAEEGLCGIAMAASYPTKTGGPEPGPTPKPPHPTPPPKPEPVACDSTSSCPPATTCCCVTNFLNICMEWGCCPIEEASCCEDGEHCCPPELPVCDTEGGRCGTGEANGPSSPWLTKAAAQRHLPSWVTAWLRTTAPAAAGSSSSSSSSSQGGARQGLASRAVGGRAGLRMGEQQEQ